MRAPDEQAPALARDHYLSPVTGFWALSVAARVFLTVLVVVVFQLDGRQVARGLVERLQSAAQAGRQAGPHGVAARAACRAASRRDSWFVETV